MTATRRALAAGLVLAALGVSAPAWAGDKARCAASYESGQRLKLKGALRDARRELGVCLSECSAAVKADCARWLEEVERALPSLVVVAERDGDPVPDATVTLDGVPVADRTRATEVDPGTHTVAASVNGETKSASVLITEGEKSRRVVITFAPTRSAPADPSRPAEASTSQPSSPIPVGSWILGGVGLAGLASFGAFAGYGSMRYSDLEACRPTCKPDDVSATKSTFLVGDVSLAVGVAALGAAVVVYLVQPKRVQSAAAPLLAPLHW